MDGLLGIDRQVALESAVNVVPLAIIGLLTLLFAAYNPWGWQEPLLVVVVFGLHLVPVVTLTPVTYLVVTVLLEADDGRSDTADRVKSWFALTDGTEADTRSAATNPSRNDAESDGR